MSQNRTVVIAGPAKVDARAKRILAVVECRVNGSGEIELLQHARQSRAQAKPPPHKHGWLNAQQLLHRFAALSQLIDQRFG